MKLKEAIEITKEINRDIEEDLYKWVAVSCNGCIYAYNKKPFASLGHATWSLYSIDGHILEQLYLGSYNGSKHWTETRRKVR